MRFMSGLPKRPGGTYDEFAMVVVCYGRSGCFENALGTDTVGSRDSCVTLGDRPYIRMHLCHATKNPPISYNEIALH
jgi:hypothetical protein